MKVSVVTIAHNEAATIASTVRSVKGQSYPNIEHILVDGDSIDDTVQLAQREFAPDVDGAVAEKEDRGKKMPCGCCLTLSERERIVTSGGREFIILSEPDRGIYDAMNKGVGLATGQIVGILNSDDFFAHDRVVERVVECFVTTGCDAVYADCCYVERENPERVTRYWKSGPYRKGAFRFGWMPPHPTFFVKKEHYDRLGAYRTDLENSADYELMLRFIHRHDLKVGYLPEVTVMMREGGASNASLRNRIRANSEDCRAWELNGLRMPFYTRYLKPLRKIPQFRARPPV